MIWHFFEVWVLMLAAFAVGCPVGATTYKLIARSPLSDLQDDIADAIGDVVDGIKSRLGIGPVWRPEYRRIVERHGADDRQDYGVHVEDRQDRLPAAGALPMLTDQSVRAHDDGIDDLAAADLLATGEAGGIADDEDSAMARPVGLATPRNGVPDDLQRIRGIGRRIEQRLNALGIFHFGQIAAWTPAEMRWMAQQLAFPDRIEWDDWIGQAIILAAGGDTGFVKSADRRRQRRREKAFEDMVQRGGEASGEIDDEIDESDEVDEIGEIDALDETDDAVDGETGTAEDDETDADKGTA
jgi:predicted flap endonuclease-1-like 5' DNA nuclease